MKRWSILQGNRLFIIISISKFVRSAHLGNEFGKLIREKGILRNRYGYGVGVEVLPKHHKKILMKICGIFSFAWKFKRFHWSTETCQPSQPVKTL